MREMEKNDPSMKAHAIRVANLCVLFLKDLERPSKEINQIYIAALLHDIGMVYIPKKISAKKNGLNEFYNYAFFYGFTEFIPELHFYTS